MAYDWKGNSERVSERVPAGTHRLRVDRIVFASKAGAFRSKSGDPQIMIVFTDADGAEVGTMFTLSDKAGWTLARLLSRAGVDMKTIERDGLEPKHFANKAVAEARLVGLETWATVEYEAADNGKSYARVTPITAEEAGTPDERAAAQKAQPKKPAAATVAAPDPFAGGGVAADDGEDIPF